MYVCMYNMYVHAYIHTYTHIHTYIHVQLLDVAVEALGAINDSAAKSHAPCKECGGAAHA
jgi:hypothetical protein